MIRAGDIMSENVIVIRPDMPIRQVAHLMLRDRVHGFPVVREGEGISGIITLTDLLRMVHQTTREHRLEEFYKKLPELKELAVADVMSRDVVVVSPQTTLPEMLQTLFDKDVCTFPVLEAGKLVGIVSRHDIMNALFSFDPVQ